MLEFKLRFGIRACLDFLMWVVNNINLEIRTSNIILWTSISLLPLLDTDLENLLSGNPLVISVTPRF